MKSERYGIEHRYIDSIQCPVDLDALVMSKDCTPKFIEENLNIGDDIMWDAIRLSTCNYWLLKLDVLKEFSPRFRKRIYKSLPAFSRMIRVYFYIQAMTSNEKELKDELLDWENEHGITDSNLNLYNPLNNLSNNLKVWDLKVLAGQLTLRKYLLDRIKAFLDKNDKSQVDFSSSLYLTELLNPKFFSQLSEAEHIVLLGNLENYFTVVEKFAKKGLTLRTTYSPHHEFNPPQHLLKHVLSGEFPYTNRVKMIAWRQLCKEVDRQMNAFTTSSGVFKIFNGDKMEKQFEPMLKRLNDAGYSYVNLAEWLDNAEGVFESFELDCTLHNLSATDYILPILSKKDYYKMADGLVNFQDDETRNMLFKEVSESMESFR